MAKFWLYKFTDDKYTDPWGQSVPVKRLSDTAVVEIIGKRPYYNGYETENINVASDGDRTFYYPIEVDYFSSGAWFEDNGTGVWYRAGRLSRVERYVDARGTPFTKEQLVEAYGE
jgi:hypothetical protein